MYIELLLTAFLESPVTKLMYVCDISCKQFIELLFALDINAQLCVGLGV